MDFPLVPVPDEETAPTGGIGLPLVPLPDDGMLDQSIRRSRGIAPDQAASDLRVYESTGMDRDFIQRNRNEVNEQFRQQSIKFKVSHTPGVKRYVSKPDNLAVSSDDLDNLTSMEGLLTKANLSDFKRSISDFTTETAKSYRGGEEQIELSKLRYRQILGEENADMDTRIKQIHDNMSARSQHESFLGKAWFGFTEMIPQLKEQFVSGGTQGLATGMGAGLAAAAGGQLGPQVALPEEVITVPTAFAGGFGVGMVKGAVETSFMLEAGGAYDEFVRFRDETGKPLDKDVARVAAVMAGGVNAGLEMFQLKTALKSIPGGDKLIGYFTTDNIKDMLKRPAMREALTKAVKTYGKTWTYETLTEVAQEGVTIMAGELAKDYSDGKFESMSGEDVVERLRETAVSAGAAFSIMALPGPSASLAKDYRVASRANKEVELFNQIDQLSAESKTRGRKDSAFENAVEEITKETNGQIDTVYIPADALFQKLGGDPDVLQAFLESVGAEKMYEEALETGGDLSIPLSKYASKIAGTPVSEALANDRRFTPDGMTANEAEEFRNNVIQDMARIVQEDKEARAVASVAETEAAEIAESFRTRLVEQGRSKNEAQHDADVWQSLLNTWTSRGFIESPKAAMQAFPSLNPDIISKPFDRVFANQSAEQMFSDKENYQGATIWDTPSGRPLIELFESADEITFVHESGHVWINAMRDMATSENAPVALVEEWNKLKEVLKIGEDNKIGRMQHETFAYMLENYFMDGKAPSLSLRGVFQHFAAWMKALYQTFTFRGSKAYDDLKPFYDRMFATDEEIAEVEEYYSSRKEFLDLNSIKDQKDRADYAKKVDLARETTFDKRLRRYRAAYLKAIGGKKEFRKRATDAINEMPVYKAMEEAVRKGGMSVAELDIYVDEATRKQFSKKRIGLTNSKAGTSPDVIATDHGFSSVPAMIGAMIKADPKAKAITDLAETLAQEEEQKIVDGLRENGSLAADADYHTPERLAVLIAEYQMVEQRGRLDKAREAGRKVRVEATAVRDAAREIIKNKLVKNASSYMKYSNAEAKAARAAQKAYAAGDMESAANFKKQEMLNHALVIESIKAREVEQKIITRIKRAVKSKPENVDQAYLNQVIALGIKYGITGKLPAEDLIALQEFMAGVSGKNAEDTESPLALNTPDWNAWLYDDSKLPTDGNSYRDTLTYDNLTELDNAVRWLTETGRDIAQGRLAHYNETLKELTDKLTTPMETVSDKKVHKWGTWFRKLSDANRKYIADHKMLPFILDMFDGFQNVGPKGNLGPNRVTIGIGLAEAQNARDIMMKEINAAIKIPMDQLVASMRKLPQAVKTDVPVPALMAQNGQFWTFDNITAVALNMGNETNIKRLVDGYGLTIGQLYELTSVLSKEDWKAIQKIWDVISGLFPKANEVHNKVNHFYQEGVKATPLTTFASDGSAVTLNGGYYPLKYDPVLSRKVAQWTEKDDLMQQTAFGHPGVKNGMMKNRQNRVTLPVLLDMSVMYSHLEEAIHYISHAAVIKDIDRITKSQKYTNTVDKKFGKEIHMLIRPMLRNIARPERMIGTYVDRKMERLRILASSSALGFNISSALKQPFSIFNVAMDIGWTGFASGLYQVVKSPIAAFNAMHEMSPYMESRSKSFDRELRDSTQRMFKSRVGAMFDQARDMSFALIKFMDFLIVYPAWWGAQQQGLTKYKGNPEMAARYADEMIRQSQPSSKPMDLSAILANRTGWSKIMSMFMTFTMNYANRQQYFYRGWREGKVPLRTYAYHLLLEAIAPPILMNMMFAALHGEEPDPEDAVVDMLMYQFSGYIFARDFAGVIGATYKKVVKGDTDTFVPKLAEIPALRGFTVIERAATSLIGYAVEMDDENKEERAMWAVAEMMSFFAGVPAARVFKNLKEGVRQFEEEDASFFEVLVPNPALRRQ